MENREAYERARTRAEAKMRFYVHLGVYVLVCTLLVVINLSAAPDQLWVQWPLLGWGLGVLLHGLNVFVFYGRSSVMDQMIHKELREES